MAKKQNSGNLQELREALQKAFRERGAIVDGMLVALLAREHMFVLGPPGTAKSALSRALCSAFKGNYFEILMTKTMAPEEIFGPLSFKALQEDKYERNLFRKLPQADIAFVDEVFKSSSAILNSLLTLMNERLYHNGTQIVQCPLQTMFGASNEIPTAEELAALYDRFALRYVTERLQDDANFISLLEEGIELKLPELTLAQLAEEQKIAAALPITREVLQILATIRREVHAEGIYVSDRKYVQAVRLVRAQAHLNKHAEVQVEDLEILENVLWQDPEQRKTIRKIVQKHINPLGEKILKIMDAVFEIPEALKAKQVEGVEAHKKVKAAIDSLKKMGDSSANPKLAIALEQASKIHQAILRDHLGVE